MNMDILLRDLAIIDPDGNAPPLKKQRKLVCAYSNTTIAKEYCCLGDPPTTRFDIRMHLKKDEAEEIMLRSGVEGYRVVYGGSHDNMPPMVSVPTLEDVYKVWKHYAPEYYALEMEVADVLGDKEKFNQLKHARSAYTPREAGGR